ncbi:hypothetical protein [Moorena producens]
MKPNIMKGNSMNKPEEEFTIKLHPRIQEKVSLDIPTDTLASLKKLRG